MLDIIRKQVGDRKSGLVFNNMNAAEKKVNDALKIFFPKKIDYLSPLSDKVQSMNLTFQTLRHANEELYNEEGISGEDKHRKVVTLRAISEGFKKGETYEFSVEKFLLSSGERVMASGDVGNLVTATVTYTEI